MSEAGPRRDEAAPPVVSVVVPTHGRPALLAEALAGVAAQTRRPDEVVVADDLGDERSAEVATACARATGLPVRYLPCPPAAGAARARNRGAAEARGEVIAFLDDDDRWAPGHLAAALDAMAAEDAPVAVTWTRFLRGDRTGDGRSVPRSLRAADVLAANPGVTGSNLVLTRAALDRVGGFDEDLTVANDQDLFLRLLDAGFAYAVVRRRLVDKRLHDGPRIATAGPGRREGLRRFAAKHGARLTPRDRRRLQAELVRDAGRTAPTPIRLLAGAYLLLLLGPAELARWRRSSRHRRLAPDTGRGC
jgi:glycosyltransferase involved in cell wall biosynthesis